MQYTGAESDSASTLGTNDQWSRWKVDLSSLKQQEILLDQKTHPDYFWKTITEKLQGVLFLCFLWDPEKIRISQKSH